MQPKTVEVIKVRNLERTKRFYETLGYALVEESHDGGPVHYSVDFGTYLWEFYPSTSNGNPSPPTKGRFLIVETEAFDRVLALCVEWGLRRDPVSYHDPPRRLRVTTVADPDGWLLHVQETAPDANPPVH